MKGLCIFLLVLNIQICYSQKVKEVETLEGCRIYAPSQIISYRKNLPNVFTWTGDCEAGLASGKGVLYRKMQDTMIVVVRGHFVAGYIEGRSEIFYANGMESYLGGMSKSLKNGYGTLDFGFNGCRYQGFWEDDLAHGEGIQWGYSGGDGRTFEKVISKNDYVDTILLSFDGLSTSKYQYINIDKKDILIEKVFWGEDTMRNCQEVHFFDITKHNGLQKFIMKMTLGYDYQTYNKYLSVGFYKDKSYALLRQSNKEFLEIIFDKENDLENYSVVAKRSKKRLVKAKADFLFLVDTKGNLIKKISLDEVIYLKAKDWKLREYKKPWKT